MCASPPNQQSYFRTCRIKYNITLERSTYIIWRSIQSVPPWWNTGLSRHWRKPITDTEWKNHVSSCGRITAGPLWPWIDDIICPARELYIHKQQRTLSYDVWFRHGIWAWNSIIRQRPYIIFSIFCCNFRIPSFSFQGLNIQPSASPKEWTITHLSLIHIWRCRR